LAEALGEKRQGKNGGTLETFKKEGRRREEDDLIPHTLLPAGRSSELELTD
jgi:hypothetical protein